MRRALARAALAAALLPALAACRADRVEITVTGADLAAVAAGGNRDLAFAARFSVPGDLDDPMRTRLAAVETALRAALPLDGFEIGTSAEEWSLTVTGRLPMTPPGAVPGAAPWAVTLGPQPEPPATLAAWPLALSADAGPGYEALAAAIGAIDPDLVPDPRQPVAFALADLGGAWDALAIGAEVGGSLALVRELRAPEAFTAFHGSDLFEALPPALLLRPAAR